MGKYAVLGAGGIGTGTARELADAERADGGHDVLLVSGSGRDPKIPGVRATAADVTDSARLSELTRGVDVIVNALNPRRYHTWPTDWPPMAESILTAATANSSGLVTVSNLYMYGKVNAPITEETPVHPNGVKGEIRATMWNDALEAHNDGRIRATELRASDYFGPGAGANASVLNRFVIRPAANAKRVRLPSGLPDVAHSWTYVTDISRFAALLATDDRSWGRVWHVPTEAPRTFREVAADVAAIVGRKTPCVAPLSRPAKLMARVSPTVRALDETAHQFERPFVIDASAATETFGLTPTPWRDALEATVRDLAPGSMTPTLAPQPS
ncbi:MAG: NAD-dependent epimerase/dehydratase family protein [Microthrixaceae bacterium]